MKNNTSIAIKLIYWPIKIFNIIFIGILLFASLAKYISPDVWTIPAYPGLIYPVILLINFGFVIFWMLTRHWWFLCSLTAIAISFLSVQSTFGFSKQTPPPLMGETISVMSYNTYACQNYKKVENNDVIKFIAEQNADVVCLQEFAVSTNANYLSLQDVKRALWQYPYSHITFKYNSIKRKSGVATFSKYPIVYKKTVPIESAYNSAQYSDIVIKGETIRVFNSHLESNRLMGDNTLLLEKKTIQEYTTKLTDKLSIGYKLRAKQAEMIAEEIKKSPYKTIVCGDFNDVPISYAYQTIRGKLKDSFVENCFGMGITFHGSWLRIRIDYILHDPAMQSFGFKKERIKHSDHYPISCGLVINGQ